MFMPSFIMLKRLAISAARSAPASGPKDYRAPPQQIERKQRESLSFQALARI
jgi:hypothetical protein